MYSLDEIEYSRTASIAAVRDYLHFLTEMYLDESMVIEPPAEGWPEIAAAALQGLGKTEEAITLLRHLPYLREPSDFGDKAQGAPWCFFVDWKTISHYIIQSGYQAESAKITTEGYYSDQIPAHVVGLAKGGRDNPIILLDIALGVVYWLECPGDLEFNSAKDTIENDPYEYAPESEADWRAGGLSWAISYFFEVLEDHYQQLHFLPLSPRKVIDVYSPLHPDYAEMIPMVQQIYRKHGWPDLAKYRKEDCLAELDAVMQERYPNHTEP